MSARRWIPQALLALGVSLLFHVAVLLLLATAAAGMAGHRGELGRLGAGGEEVAFEIAAADPVVASQPDQGLADQGLAEPQRMEPQRAEPPQEAVAETVARPRESELESVQRGPEEAREPVTNPEPPDAPPPEPEAANQEASAERDSVRGWVLRPAGEQDADDSGRLEGDPEAAAEAAVGAAAGRGNPGEAASALAPEGSLCADPVAGTWVALKYKSGVGTGRWVRFTLFVEREGTTLRGRILSRIWDGGPSDRRPPRDAEGECRAFDSDMTWIMQAEGLFRGNSMTFAAESARLIRQDCPGPGLYAPDRFTGTVDSESDRFRARNNDGAFDIDEPYTFRRTACD